MRDYGKVYATFWSSQTTHTLSDDGKLLALYLMTCSHSTIAGVFRLPDGYVAEDIGWDQSRVQKGFAELLAKGFANRCETTKWVWVVKHLEWNKPENPNQRKSAAKIAHSIPDECAWKPAFMRACAESLGIELPATANGSTTVAEPLLNQEQKQEQEIEPNGSVGSADRLPRCDTQSVVDLYHEVLPELPAVRLMNDQRRKAVSSLWKFVLTSRRGDGERRATTAPEAMDWIRGYFTRARDNDFLMGRGYKAPGHEGWQCDFDFLLSEKGKKHVIEKTQVTA
jgi:hypothetical protein